jgi:AcrR family transcriptional regulator
LHGLKLLRMLGANLCPITEMPQPFTSARFVTPIVKLDRPRLSASDWELGALEMIADLGLAAVAVEPLAKRLGVTKGSFYWHFDTREALIDSTLKRWSDDDAGDVISRVQGIADPRERLRTLFRVTSRTMRLHKIYSALIKAIDHPSVGPRVEKISEARLKFLTQLFTDAGLQPVRAAHRARLAFAAYVGFLQMSLQIKLPRLTSGEFDAYVEHVIETLVP